MILKVKVGWRLVWATYDAIVGAYAQHFDDELDGKPLDQALLTGSSSWSGRPRSPTSTETGYCRRFARDQWHDDGMTRIRLSTTVDASLLEHARNARSGTTDAALVDEALAALLARYRSAEVDASYAAYDEHPLDEPDEWGDLASFRRAASAS